MSTLSELVVFSLEEWDDVWRRNQFFVDILLRRNPSLRLLYFEPPADPLHDIMSKTRPRLPRLRRICLDESKFTAVRPFKPLPRRAGKIVDTLLFQQAKIGMRAARFGNPVIWMNDGSYAPLVAQLGLPSVYDITDDWTLLSGDPSATDRLRKLDELALRTVDEVVVCSSALARSRGRERSVTLIPNGVATDHFRAPRPRPTDLPPSPCAVYVGALHDERLDIPLVVELTAAGDLQVVLVGPDSLSPESRTNLQAAGVLLLGPRPYETVPAYLQHADVVIIPHKVSLFTESLDPIKAYECQAVGRPTVATPVAGFRDLGAPIQVAARDEFVRIVRGALERTDQAPLPIGIPSWDERAEQFERVLRLALDQRSRASR